MCIVFSLFPMSFWLSMAYVVLYLASRSEGTRRVAGRALGLWFIGLAVCCLAMGVTVQVMGSRSIEGRVIRALVGEQPAPTFVAPPPSAARRSF